MKSKSMLALCVLLSSVSGMALATSAYAQTPAPAKPATTGTSADSNEVGQIVVTGSRTNQLGYQAPTPVTVATAAQLLLAAPTAIADGLNKLPQFNGSFGPNKQSNVFGTPTHGNVLNLRGIGPTRTLILLDGLRAPPSTYQNTVNVDAFPTLLVQRVDVVTAGVSSVYGSDAVAGVVNFVLDSKFTGVKGLVQGGVTTRGDNANTRLGLAVGQEVLGGKGHFIGSLDFNLNNGYLDRDRPTVGQAGVAAGSTGIGVAGTASNPLVQLPNARANFGTLGGLAFSGPFNGTNFSSPGVFGPANKGTATGSSAFFVAPSDYIFQGYYLSGAPLTRNLNGFGRFTYDLTPTTSVYAQAMLSKSDIGYHTYPNLAFAGSVLNIFSGNAFLPAPLQAQLTSTNTASFTLEKLFDEFGPILTKENIQNYDFAAGIKGEVSQFRWSIDYVHGDSEYHFKQRNQFDLAKLAAAVDSVVNPATGQIVCRPTLSADPGVRALYANCVPLNVFGYGAASTQAAQYALGTSVYNAINVTNDVTATVAGDLFRLPAGPVGVSVGAEYRDASLNLKSNSDPGTPVNIAGLRGIAATTTRYYLTNVANARGSNNVKEAFGEIQVPLLKDVPLAQNLDVNGAFRVTDYSTSGSVHTWKVGGTWTPVEGLRLRATRSRDIRAPTLFDLFAGPQFTQGAALDPHTGISTGFNQITSGNAKLTPEIGHTFTTGFVIQPTAFRGFSLALDYYRVRINNAITALTSLAILQDCESSGGTAPSCANITRPLPFSDRSAANVPSQVTVSGINAALINTNGFDLDASYRTRVGEGQLTMRVFANYLSTFKTQLSSAQKVINYAGYNAAGSGGVTGGLPKWRGSLNATYEVGPWSVFVQENFVGSLKFGPVLIYADPHIPSWYTTDATLTYKVRALGKDMRVFGSVTNLFDKDAPPVFSTALPSYGGTLLNLYDTTGRAFVGGVRFTF